MIMAQRYENSYDSKISRVNQYVKECGMCIYTGMFAIIAYINIGCIRFILYS
jgi:hypothetical protein